MATACTSTSRRCHWQRTMTGLALDQTGGGWGCGVTLRQRAMSKDECSWLYPRMGATGHIRGWDLSRMGAISHI